MKKESKSFKWLLMGLFMAVFSVLLVGCAKNNSSSNIKAGTYSASAKGFDGKVPVKVTIDANGKITKVDADVSGETKGLGAETAGPMAKKIIEKQSVKVDVVSGASKTSNAILTATKEAIKKSGANIDNYTGSKEKKQATKDKTINTDVAVIGAGASGISASAAAIDGGAKVVMVEKTKGIGGISKFFAGGPFAVESDLQKKAGGKYAAITKEEVLQTLNEYGRYINYGPLTKAIIDKSGDTINWMNKWGVKFHVNPETPQVAHRDDDLKWRLYHWYDLFSYKPTKTAAIDVVYNNLLKKGLKTEFQTAGKELITDKNGKVTGIVCQRKNGSKVTIHAKKVIIGTGGFAGNADMMKEYYHTDNLGGWGEMGDGVNMAWKAGAAKWDTSSSLLHGNGMIAPKNPTKVALATSPFNQIEKSPLMWVDESGNRYCNEEAVWDTALDANTAYAVGGKFFIVLDQATLDGYSNGKHPVMDSAVGGPNMEKANFTELANEGVKQGIVVKADSISELAKKLKMDPSRLEQNVSDYNKVVETKKDPYGKSAASLMYNVAKGPFYAVKMQIGNLGTLGGVRVNEKLQATDGHLKPIKNLFVVGNDAAGFYGNTTTYPPYEGLATGFAWNSGRIAGEEAAKEL